MELFADARGARGVPWLLLLLLLLTVCFVKAAADCSRPKGMENNMVLSDHALLMNRFPEGTFVFLECAIGYVLDSGSGRINCSRGAWTHPDLRCKKKDCGQPKAQANMSFNTSAGTLFGDIISVFCDKGYKISGVSYKQCYASGWAGRSKCEIVTCDTPPEVANGRRSWDAHGDPKYGEEVLYTCDEGYALVGAARMACSDRGDYSSQPPQCSGVTTGEPITTPTSQAHRDKPVPATTAAAFPTSEREKPGGTGKRSKYHDYIPVILSVIGVSLVACIVVFFIHKYLLRRKGSVHRNGAAPIA